MRSCYGSPKSHPPTAPKLGGGGVRLKLHAMIRDKKEPAMCWFSVAHARIVFFFKSWAIGLLLLHGGLV